MNKNRTHPGLDLSDHAIPLPCALVFSILFVRDLDQIVLEVQLLGDFLYHIRDHSLEVAVTASIGVFLNGVR